MLRLSAEDATSTKEGAVWLYSVATVTSPWSELETEDELNVELLPEARPRAPSRLPPRPPLELRLLPRLPRPKVGRVLEPLPPPGVPPLPPPFPPRRLWESPPPPLPLHHHGRRHPRSRHPRGGSTTDRGCRGYDQIEGWCGPQLTLLQAVADFGPRLSYRQELRQMHRRTPD